MEFVLILLAIFWVVIPIVAKNSQKKAKEEEERKRAMQQQAPQLQRAQQPVRTGPLTPSMRAPMQASYEGTSSVEGNFSGSMDGTSRKTVTFDALEAKSTLTEADTSITHSVTVSSESGHAHEETSAKGIQEDCPPEKKSAKPAAPVATGTGEKAFIWDVEATRNGIVMAEILGPCLALRD
jgi:hypothetical protein